MYSQEKHCKYWNIFLLNGVFWSIVDLFTKMSTTTGFYEFSSRMYLENANNASGINKTYIYVGIFLILVPKIHN